MESRASVCDVHVHAGPLRDAVHTWGSKASFSQGTPGKATPSQRCPLSPLCVPSSRACRRQLSKETIRSQRGQGWKGAHCWQGVCSRQRQLDTGCLPHVQYTQPHTHTQPYTQSHTRPQPPTHTPLDSRSDSRLEIKLREEPHTPWKRCLQLPV